MLKPWCFVKFRKFKFIENISHSFSQGFEIWQRKDSYPSDFLSEWLCYQFKNLFKLRTSIYFGLYIHNSSLKNNIAGFRDSEQYIPASVYLLYVQFRLIAKAVVIRHFSLCCPVLRVLYAHCVSENCLARMPQSWLAASGLGGVSALHWLLLQKVDIVGGMGHPTQLFLFCPLSPPVPDGALPTLSPCIVLAASPQDCAVPTQLVY